jgi:hypothetical protein
MTLLVILISIPAIILNSLFLVFMVLLTHTAFVWKDTWMVSLCAIFWATFSFGICLVVWSIV